jgi:hypothetical protein
MTLPAYSGRHSVFDGTTVLPVVTPPAGLDAWPRPGGPPGRPRPTTVSAVFWLAVAQAVLALLGAGFLALILLAAAARPGDGLTAAGVVVGVTVIVAVGWLGLAWLVRGGSRVARVVLAVITALGALVAFAGCVLEFALIVPVLALALHVAVLVLLFTRDATAWFAPR